jgi:hypothetical protein
MNAHFPITVDEADMLHGVEEIAGFLSTLGSAWTVRQVRQARTVRSLPIRKLTGIGIYAFKSELIAALKAPETLTPAKA